VLDKRHLASKWHRRRKCGTQSIINAGILTFAVWAWANWVYRNRSADGVHFAKISEGSQQREVHCEDALQLL
jgi:hypothetical protein